MNLLAAESLDGRQMPRRYPTVLMLLVGLIVCAADAYAASKTRQPKMPTEQQFLQGQMHTCALSVKLKICQLISKVALWFTTRRPIPTPSPERQGSSRARQR